MESPDRRGPLSKSMTLRVEQEEAAGGKEKKYEEWCSRHGAGGGAGCGGLPLFSGGGGAHRRAGGEAGVVLPPAIGGRGKAPSSSSALSLSLSLGEAVFSLLPTLRTAMPAPSGRGDRGYVRPSPLSELALWPWEGRGRGVSSAAGSCRPLGRAAGRGEKDFSRRSQNKTFGASKMADRRQHSHRRGRSQARWPLSHPKPFFGALAVARWAPWRPAKGPGVAGTGGPRSFHLLTGDCFT